MRKWLCTNLRLRKQLRQWLRMQTGCALPADAKAPAVMVAALAVHQPADCESSCGNGLRTIVAVVKLLAANTGCRKPMISISIKRPKLLSSLFKRSSCCDMGCDPCCAAPSCDSGCNSCGGNAPVAAPAASGAAPAPPAPVVDPSAYLNSKRRVVQTSFVR